jgi:hypothetical protein
MNADKSLGRKTTVGASLLANGDNIFASKLAPTRSKTRMDNQE